MTVWQRLTFMLLAPALLCGTTYTFLGPDDANGLPCLAGAPHCIVGDPLIYEMFSVQLTSPSNPGGKWGLTILTNFMASLPGTPDIIPDYAYEGVLFPISDFLISWNGNDYGIVLHPHDGYAAGDFYEAATFQTSKDVMGGQVPDIPRPELPVLLGQGGALLGAGTLAAAANPGGNGVTSAMYVITDQFSAPSTFLSSGNFTIYASSYVCANGYITGTDPVVPEPVSFLLVGSALLTLGLLHYRKR